MLQGADICNKLTKVLAQVKLRFWLVKETLHRYYNYAITCLITTVKNILKDKDNVYQDSCLNPVGQGKCQYKNDLSASDLVRPGV